MEFLDKKDRMEYELNNKHWNLLVTMVRTYSLEKSNFINIICSTILYRSLIDFKEIDNYIKEFDISPLGTRNERDKFYIFYLELDLFEKIEYEITDYNNFKVVKIGITEFLLGKDVKHSWAWEIFNKKKENKNYFDYIVHNLNSIEFIKNDMSKVVNPMALFIFNQMDWKTIVSFFRLNNIMLTGGNNINRHKLSSLQVRLYEYLRIIAKGDCSIIDWCLKENMKIKENDPYIDKNLLNTTKKEIEHYKEFPLAQARDFSNIELIYREFKHKVVNIQRDYKSIIDYYKEINKILKRILDYIFKIKFNYHRIKKLESFINTFADKSKDIQEFIAQDIEYKFKGKLDVNLFLSAIKKELISLKEEYNKYTSELYKYNNLKIGYITLYFNKEIINELISTNNNIDVIYHLFWRKKNKKNSIIQTFK